MSFRILCEDILGLLYRVDEIQPAPAGSFGPDELARIMPDKSNLIRLAIRSLRRADRISQSGRALSLTDHGREEARKLVRSHRLWESYLFKHLQLPADHVHATAERLEHITNKTIQDELGEGSGLPSHDPHGKKIP